jgi:hypothetical protein
MMLLRMRTPPIPVLSPSHSQRTSRGVLSVVRLIKTRLNETNSKIRTGKHLSDAFPIQNCLKQGDAL